MAISLPIKPHCTRPLCPKKSDNRPSGEQFILNTINNALFCRLSLATNKEFNYSSHGRHFVCKLSLVLSGSLLRNDAVCLSYLFIKLVNDILDTASSKSEKFILPAIVVQAWRLISVKIIYCVENGRPAVRNNWCYLFSYTGWLLCSSQNGLTLCAPWLVMACDSLEQKCVS